MGKFIVRRLTLIPMILILMNFLGFTYAHYARPIRATHTPYIRLVESGPLLPAYYAYLKNLMQFDFNAEVSVFGDRNTSLPLRDALVRAIFASMGLLVFALAMSISLGWIVGIKAVHDDPPGVARWLSFLSTIGLSMPSFYIGSLFIVCSVFYVLWRGPGSQMLLPIEGYGWDLHLVFPTLALMAHPTVQIAQVIANLLSNELGQQYIVAARSLGYSKRTIRNRIALRNIIAPTLLTIAGMTRLLFGEQVLIEWLFKWPGLGRLLAWTLVPPQLSSTHGSPLFLNPQVVATVLTLIAALFLLTDFCASLLVQALDPRARKIESREGEF